MSAKVMIVTGGSRGIGAATVRLAAAHGFAVCVNYRENRSAADELVQSIVASGGRAIAVAADVSVEADVMRLFATVDAELGTVDALVNNAGILGPQGRVADLDAARLTRLLATNVTGTLVCCREAIRRMSSRYGGKGGAIVNLSSVAARAGAPGEYVDYASTKGAVDTLTLGLAREVAGEGIRVNSVRPGLIYTEIHASGGIADRVDRLASTVPMQRGGTAGEVAEAIIWLTAPESSYVTGTILDVTGGR